MVGVVEKMRWKKCPVETPYGVAQSPKQPHGTKEIVVGTRSAARKKVSCHARARWVAGVLPSLRPNEAGRIALARCLLPEYTKPEIELRTDVETDGPILGPHSMEGEGVSWAATFWMLG